MSLLGEFAANRPTITPHCANTQAERSTCGMKESAKRLFWGAVVTITRARAHGPQVLPISRSLGHLTFATTTTHSGVINL
jgi:hypothetical protein